MEWISHRCCRDQIYLAAFMPDFRSSRIAGNQHILDAFGRRQLLAADPKPVTCSPGMDMFTAAEVVGCSRNQESGLGCTWYWHMHGWAVEASAVRAAVPTTRASVRMSTPWKSPKWLLRPKLAQDFEECGQDFAGRPG